MKAFHKLFEVGSIGSLYLKNRIVMPAMGTSMASQSGFVTERMINYYAERAKGGVGLIVVENTLVDRSKGYNMPNQLTIDDPQGGPRLYELVERIHQHRAKVAIQLSAAGAKAKLELTPEVIPDAPSAIKWERLGVIPHEISPKEIERYIKLFADGARRAKLAGFDAIEIHCAHGYLLSSFISAYSNRRKDEYGGILENRMRFPLEVIKAVRAEVGEDYPLLVRYNCEEYIEGGIDIEEGKKIGQLLEKSGVNALDLSAGNSVVNKSAIRSIPPAFLPLGHIIPLSEAVKSVVNIPVIVTGKIKDPQMAEDALLERKTDFVGVGRCLITDPEWPTKSFEGRVEDIRKCTGCNTYCIYEKSWLGRPMRCQVNPMVGREAEFQMQASSNPKKIVVIGGGPAGMEASRVAALKGHDVTIIEKEPELGGQLKAAVIPPHKEIHYSLEFLTTQMNKLGVKIQLNTIATSEMLEKQNADLIIIATGAKPKFPSRLFKDQDNVHTAVDILLSKDKLIGERVVVIGGGIVGCETAEYLAEIKKKQVVIIEMLNDIAKDAEPFYTRPALIERLAKNSIEIMVNTTFKEITDDNTITCLNSDGNQLSVEYDEIVFASGHEPDNTIVIDLKKHDLKLVTIGDCIEAKNLRSAIFEGFIAGFYA
jgi:2,4-dienoyl-CoA reductase-like NADH-dependent reductase (Old Yellow Enzyme family)/thioredoxin reductase